MSVLAPVGDPLYRKLRPKLALREDGLTTFDGDDRLAWHPAAASLATLLQGGQARGHAGHRVRGSRPVALHLAPLLGGRRAQRERAHRLARPLARHGRVARQPDAGAVARRPAGAHARHVARSGGRRLGPGGVQLLGAQRVGADRGADARDDRLARRGPRLFRRPGARPGGRGGGAVGPAARAAVAVHRRGRLDRRTGPVPRRRRRLPPPPQGPGGLLARDCRFARSRSRARASTTRTTTSPRTSSPG